MSNSSFQTSVVPTKELDLSAYSLPNESLHDAEEQIQCELTSLDVKGHVRKKELKTDKIRKTSRKKHKHDSRSHKPEYERNVENLYFEDKHRDKGNINIDTFCSRVRPLYDVSEKYIGFVKRKQPKKIKFHRYYIKNIDSVEALKKKDTIIKKTNVKESSEQDKEVEESLPWCKNLEEEQKSKTREYNKQLTENPYNVELWLQYINFQVLNIFFTYFSYL